MSLSKEQQWRLVEQLRAGDSESRGALDPAREQAMRRLILDFRAPSWGVICRTLRGGGMGMEHADEAWQQACFKFFAVGLWRIPPEVVPRSYFLRIALHATIDLLRERRHRPLDEAHHALPEGMGDPLTHLVDRSELARQIAALRRCITSLEGVNMDAARHFYLEQEGSCQQSADALGISRAALMKRLERARHALARCVQRQLAMGEHR